MVLAALVATLGALDLAEEAFQEATVAALDAWARDGLAGAQGASARPFGPSQPIGP